MASPIAPDGPTAQYQRQIAEGEIRPDPDQARLVARFERLYHDLKNYPEAQGRGSRLGLKSWRLFRIFDGGKTSERPHGLYVVGGVGRGKSMLMDLFYKTAPLKAKRRVHFHEFMLEVHDRINAWKKLDAKGRVAAGGKASDDDPIPPVADQIARSATLLCFDELQVHDIADAMVLHRLFGELWDAGVIVVATSNRLPDELYKGGINRQLFLPFIERLKNECENYSLNGPTDYRLDRLRGMTTYYTPVDATSTQALTDAFWQLTDRDVEDSAKVPSATLCVQGRELFVPKSARGVAVFSFKRLCANPLGSADYLMIARNYHTVIMVAIPQMGPEKRNEAKRFVTFIDALYEQGVKFLCSADVMPTELYQAGDGSFEFDRTVSRLMEMQSQEYLARGHGDAASEAAE